MSRSNRLDNYRAHLDSLFNFSFNQNNIKTTSTQPKTPILLTPDEKRSLGMWLSTVLELHTQQFLHALKHCRILSVGQFQTYLQTHYSHLKEIIRFYIIALLIDYARICSMSPRSAQTQKPCIFLNIIIEELASRFFRESQWLHKISHLPVYTIFPIFDRFHKGYTTLGEIVDVLTKYFVNSKKVKQLLGNGKKELKLRHLVQRKLSGNVGVGDDTRIYQQNLEEVMLRVNLVAFEGGLKQGKDQQTISSRFEVIRQEIKKEKEIDNQRKIRAMENELRRSRREEEELELLREDYDIKQKSQIMSGKEYKSQIARAQWQSQAHKDKFLSTPYSTQISKPNPKYETGVKSDHRTELYSASNGGLNPKTSQIVAYSLSSRKENTSDYHNKIQAEVLFHDMAETEKNKSKLALRRVIMRELQVLREEKNKNYLAMLEYI